MENCISWSVSNLEVFCCFSSVGSVEKCNCHLSKMLKRRTVLKMKLLLTWLKALTAGS